VRNELYVSVLARRKKLERKENGAFKERVYGPREIPFPIRNECEAN